MSQIIEESGEQSQPQTQAEAESALEPQPEAAPSALPDPKPEPSPAPSRRERRKQVRKTRVVVRRVGPISVFKLSLIFYFCLMLIVFGGLLILFGIMSATDVIDGIAKAITGLGLSNADPENYVIDGNWLFTWIFVVGCGMVVVASIINLLVAFLYNLISDVVGGLEVTLAEKRSR